MKKRFIGVDIGAETIKAVELTDSAGPLQLTRHTLIEHHKDPAPALLELLGRWDWETVAGAAVSGRFSRLVRLDRVPTKQAQATGFRFNHPEGPATVVSIGGHGFSVLELRDSGIEVFRENSRCSQGTGNFLRQLVARFNMNIEQASELCESVDTPAPLSGRCPVILKTDMTHLANKGESKARILAGLYDAVCENVQVLLKPRVSPERVLLAGGVSRSLRIQKNFRDFLARHEMELLPITDVGSLYLEALGCAVTAAEHPAQVPALGELLAPPQEAHLDRLPGFGEFLPQVKRMPRHAVVPGDGETRVVLGFDIGSTGSKAVAVNAETREVTWEGYINTDGNPVVAAQTLMRKFVDGPSGQSQVVALGATGSGREIVGSLLSTCYGVDTVYVLNEIAAHAEGALHFDATVDTIFEIGGQDAKYIRLAEGRVIDAAMNEACSAGTGSFIEEQGRKFSGVRDVVHLGQEAVAADCGVSLGQHCSVFMAEIIDEAVAAGVDNRAIIAGIYDSIIQNYLNRVKGSRSVGQVIFCQGMPFSADALAAAVARQTGSRVIIPPNPGTVGALGIGLLTLKSIELEQRQPVDPQRFLGAQVDNKDVFICKATKGCGGSGNHCRIDRIATVVEGKRQRFTWGGGCSLWDKGTGKQKLPDLSPDPFRQREEMVKQLIAGVSASRGRKTIGITDEFQLKTLFPFFATFLYELGFDLKVRTDADQGALKRGIEEANVPFCAPMQQYHGLISAMADEAPDYLFMPMLRGLPRVGDETHAVSCPIVQASSDMLRWDLGETARETIISPLIEFGERNLESKEFLESCTRVARELRAPLDRFGPALQAAMAAQRRFETQCYELGREALRFARERGLITVIVLGRPYTIYNTVLNSNVPAILREQGAIALPVDCYPIEDGVPIFRDVYWSYGQRNLRAAHQMRREEGIYPIWCSNYSCGPDSFNLHFFSYIMEGKPFAIIETDGHSGDAGTKTRVEAFLHCVRQDLENETPDAVEIPAELLGPAAQRVQQPNALRAIERDKSGLPDIRRRGERVLIPRMGPGAECLAAALRGIGVAAECLPMPDRETVRIGRRYTSGKECVPMTVTLGALLQRIERDRDTDEHFAFFMPTACGPCRFGVYNILHKITLERLGWKDRVRTWSPIDADYFEGVPAGFSMLVFTGFMAMDTLLDALYDVRPVEKHPGAADAIYRRYTAELARVLEQAGRGDLSVPAALMQLVNGRLFGCTDLLRQAAAEFAAVKTHKHRPCVMVVGEIYVRCDDFSNDFVVNKLEERGIRVRFAPFNEWLEYTDHINMRLNRKTGFSKQLSSFVQRRIQARVYALVGDVLGWPPRLTVKETMNAAEPYVRADLTGEAVLTVGGPLHEYRHGLIDGVLSVGPLECMPNKISEAQLFHVAEQDGLLSLSVPLNGDPIDPEVIDNFAFEVHSRFRRRVEATVARGPKRAAGQRSFGAI